MCIAYSRRDGCAADLHAARRRVSIRIDARGVGRVVRRAAAVVRRWRGAIFGRFVAAVLDLGSIRARSIKKSRSRPQGRKRLYEQFSILTHSGQRVLGGAHEFASNWARCIPSS